MYWPTITVPSVCHPLSPDKEGYFVCLSAVAPFSATVWVLSLSLSLYYSWHAPSGSNSACFFWVVCHPNRTLPLKEPEQEPQRIDFSPLPTTKPYPFTSNPQPHHALYWLGTSWWCLGLARAFLPYVSKICLLPIRLPWSGGLPA